MSIIIKLKNKKRQQYFSYIVSTLHSSKVGQQHAHMP